MNDEELSPAMKYYYKNQDKIKKYQLDLYYKNKEKINEKRRENYAKKNKYCNPYKLNTQNNLIIINKGNFKMNDNFEITKVFSQPNN